MSNHVDIPYGGAGEVTGEHAPPGCQPHELLGYLPAPVTLSHSKS